MTARWHPPADLRALLDALEAELLDATDEEVRAALAETGRARDATLHEVRALLAAAEPDGEAPRGPVPASGPAREGGWTRRH